MSAKRTLSLKQLRRKSNIIDKKIIKLINETATANPRRMNTIKRKMIELQNQANNIFKQIMNKTSTPEYEILLKRNALIKEAVGNTKYDDNETKQIIETYGHIFEQDVNSLYNNKSFNKIEENKWEIITDLINDVDERRKQQNDSDYLFNIGEPPFISYKNEQNEIKKQRGIVENIIKRLKKNPINCLLDIEEVLSHLNDYGKTLIFRSFHQFFVKTIGKIAITMKCFIKYFITTWHSKSFNGEEYNKLLNNFIKESMAYSIEHEVAPRCKVVIKYLMKKLLKIWFQILMQDLFQKLYYLRSLHWLKLELKMTMLKKLDTTMMLEVLSSNILQSIILQRLLLIILKDFKSLIHYMKHVINIHISN